MSVLRFEDLILMSEMEISKMIVETENKLFKLRFKKRRPNFKPHEIKKAKSYLARLKTCLTIKQKSLI